MTVALEGDFGKLRTALVIQSDRFETSATVTVLLVSSALVDAPLFRVDVESSVETGLREPSQIMLDKAMTVRRERIGVVIGHLDDDAMLSLERNLALWFGLAR